MSLAERLKTETKALHTAAERSGFMGVLLRGRMERDAYCALLRNLLPIYAALEPALQRHAQHPSLAPVHAPALFRAAALEHDLRVLSGLGAVSADVSADVSAGASGAASGGAPAAAEAPALRPATIAYTARLRVLEATQPELLLAHAYVRYLGDLSGGQMLRRIVAQGTAFDGSGAVAFYEFGDAAATQALTLAFRAGLASITLPPEREDALVEEAKSAFELHRRLFDELATDCGLA